MYLVSARDYWSRRISVCNAHSGGRYPRRRYGKSWRTRNIGTHLACYTIHSTPSILSHDSPNFSSTIQAVRLIVNQARKYARTVEPLIEILVPGHRWGHEEHEVIWAQLVQDLTNANRRVTGETVLINLQRFAVLPVVHEARMAALSRRKYGALRAITTDAKYRSHQGSPPVVSIMHPWARLKMPS